MCNIATGGEGGKGSSPETIEKIRKAHLGRKLSEESKRKISVANKGKKFTESHKEKLKQARRKRVISKETRQKTKQTSTGKINIKKYVLIDPSGKKHTTNKGLSDFCRSNNLQAPNLIKVLNGERKHHKGWKIKNAYNQLNPRQ